MKKPIIEGGERGDWALPAVDSDILDEADDRFALQVLEFIMVSRARTTREERDATVAAVRDTAPPLREAVRRELVARGLFPVNRPLAGEEIEEDDDIDIDEEDDDVDMDELAARALEFLGIPTPKPGEPIQWPNRPPRAE